MSFTNRSLSTQSLEAFTLFIKIPIELRLKIWKIAHADSEGKVVEITFEQSIQLPVSLSLSSALIRVCRESRTELWAISKQIAGVSEVICESSFLLGNRVRPYR